MTLLMRDRENLERGRSEGLAEGLTVGRSEGLAEGLSTGRSEGLAEGKRMLMKNALHTTHSVKQTAVILQLGEEEVREVAEEEAIMVND